MIAGQLEISRKSLSKSLEPSLLLQVVSEGPMTHFHYKNTSLNTFYDLNIGCKIHYLNQDLDYSWLFDRDMYMAPQDTRIKSFELLKDLLSKGHNIRDYALKGNEVLLLLSFSYTFENEKKEYKIQNYRWNVDFDHWAIK
jgi:hypothetical protein